MTKQQNGMCAQWRLRSARASAQSDQSLLCAQWVTKGTSFLHADNEDWSDWADAKADLSSLGTLAIRRPEALPDPSPCHTPIVAMLVLKFEVHFITWWAHNVETVSF